MRLPLHHQDLHEQLDSALDFDHLSNLLRRDAYTAELLLSLLRFFVGRITALEAVERATQSAVWFKQAESIIQRVAAAAGGRVNPTRLPLRALLPRVFAWLFFKVCHSTPSTRSEPALTQQRCQVDQIRVDMANYYLGVLGPHLARGGVGASYERTKYEAALQAREIGTWATREWLAAAVAQTAKLCEGTSFPLAKVSNTCSRITCCLLTNPVTSPRGSL